MRKDNSNKLTKCTKLLKPFMRPLSKQSTKCSYSFVAAILIFSQNNEGKMTSKKWQPEWHIIYEINDVKKCIILWFIVGEKEIEAVKDITQGFISSNKCTFVYNSSDC